MLASFLETWSQLTEPGQMFLVFWMGDSWAGKHVDLLQHTWLVVKWWKDDKCKETCAETVLWGYMTNE